MTRAPRVLASILMLRTRKFPRSAIGLSPGTGVEA
jgi:hypothetical protein